MQFDIRTLIVAVALANVFCAGARLLLWRMHPTIPGLGRWALAGGAGALALFMILFYGIKHWSPSLSLAQLVVVIGLVLSWDGFRRFIGQPPVSAMTLATCCCAGSSPSPTKYFAKKTSSAATAARNLSHCYQMLPTN